MTVGITRFTGESAFTLTPSAGVLIPLEGKPFSLYGSIGFPARAILREFRPRGSVWRRNLEADRPIGSGKVRRSGGALA